MVNRRGENNVVHLGVWNKKFALTKKEIARTTRENPLTIAIYVDGDEIVDSGCDPLSICIRSEFAPVIELFKKLMRDRNVNLEKGYEVDAWIEINIKFIQSKAKMLCRPKLSLVKK